MSGGNGVVLTVSATVLLVALPYGLVTTAVKRAALSATRVG